MIFLQINAFTVYLEKYSKTLSLLFYLFLNSRSYLTECVIICFSKTLVWQKWQQMVEIAVQTHEKSNYGSVLNNKYIMKRKVLVLLYSANKIQGKLSESKLASQSLTNFNELSKSQVNIPLYKHDTHPSNCLLVQEDIFVIFSTFKQRFQFLGNKLSFLETLQFVEKSCKRGICYCYYNFHFVTSQIKLINKQSYLYIFHFANTETFLPFQKWIYSQFPVSLSQKVLTL